MAIERTFSIIKPDAVERNLVGKIIAHFEANGLRPVALRRHHMSLAEAQGFYAVHKARGCFAEMKGKKTPANFANATATAAMVPV